MMGKQIDYQALKQSGTAGPVLSPRIGPSMKVTDKDWARGRDVL